MRKTSERLASALALFEGGKRWMKGSLLSRRVNPGEPLDRALETSEQFCAIGALLKDAHAHNEPMPKALTKEFAIDWDLFIEPVVRAMRLRCSNNIIQINDNAATDFGDVKQLFCTGIKNALDEEEARELTCPTPMEPNAGE